MGHKPFLYSDLSDFGFFTRLTEIQFDTSLGCLQLELSQFVTVMKVLSGRYMVFVT